MRRAARTDKNHAEIVKAFRRLGASVLDLSRVGAGCPDLLVAQHGVNILVEVKFEKGGLTPDQKVFHDAWKGQICIARTAEDVAEIVNVFFRPRY